MNDLVYLKNDEAVCSSLDVAEKFHKRHDKLIHEIERMYGELEEIGSPQNGGHPLFRKTYYTHPQNGQRYPKYIMNRDGFSLLVMGFTGKKALEWKLQYIKAFNQMESFIKEKATQTWIETRKAGKLTRKAETDTIQKLVEYAKSQGSEHADKLYMTYKFSNGPNEPRHYAGAYFIYEESPHNFDSASLPPYPGGICYSFIICENILHVDRIRYTDFDT